MTSYIHIFTIHLKIKEPILRILPPQTETQYADSRSTEVVLRSDTMIFVRRHVEKRHGNGSQVSDVVYISRTRHYFVLEQEGHAAYIGL